MLDLRWNGLCDCPDLTRLRVWAALLNYGNEPRPFSEMVNLAQSLENHGTTQEIVALKAAIRASRGKRRSMNTSTEDKIKGTFHEVKGAIKEEVGKVTNDHDLKAEGRTEKKAGEIQHHVGDAKEDVAKLKDKLTRVEKE